MLSAFGAYSDSERILKLVTLGKDSTTLGPGDRRVTGGHRCVLPTVVLRLRLLTENCTIALGHVSVVVFFVKSAYIPK